MGKIEEILQSNLKPKEKQTKLVDAVCNGKIKDKPWSGHLSNLPMERRSPLKLAD